MHDVFPCTEISYTLSSGEIRIVHKDISSGRRIQQCVMCITEAQAVSGCPRGLYQCDDGSCIIPAAVCDGKWDCLHGEDEHKCDTTMCHINDVFQNQTFCQTECSVEVHDCLCGLDFWQCRSGGCIAVSKYCDHQEDCQDASDESHSCQSTQCKNEEAACRSGQYVDKQAIFDLQRNCLDNSNEHNDNFTTVTSSCFSVDHMIQDMLCHLLE